MCVYACIFECKYTLYIHTYIWSITTITFMLDNVHTIQDIWYFKLMHYDMCVIVGIPKSVYPLHVHMK